MGRSVKKGPFVDQKLLKKIVDMNKAGEKPLTLLREADAAADAERSAIKDLLDQDELTRFDKKKRRKKKTPQTKDDKSKAEKSNNDKSPKDAPAKESGQAAGDRNDNAPRNDRRPKKNRPPKDKK